MTARETSTAQSAYSGAYDGTRRRFPRLSATAVLVCGLALVWSTAALAADASTLEDVRQRGTLRCGVHEGLQGFSTANSLGEYAGLDVDLCRAVASAVFDDADKVEYVTVDSDERFGALGNRRVDILSRNTTWTLTRNARFGEFVGINYHDGQGFMVSKRGGIRSALQLDDASICVARNTTTELNAIDFFRLASLRYRPFHLESEAALAAAFEAGKCQALAADRSALAAFRSRFTEPADYTILPEIISKEPLGPMVRSGDANWTNVVRWSLNCMINAEELGITQATVDSAATERTPSARRLLGLDENLGRWLGLDAGWCAAIVRNVGNYAESYERHLGPDTVLGLERGVNDLWTNGGLLYAPPIR